MGVWVKCLKNNKQEQAYMCSHFFMADSFYTQYIPTTFVQIFTMSLLLRICYPYRTNILF